MGYLMGKKKPSIEPSRIDYIKNEAPKKRPRDRKAYVPPAKKKKVSYTPPRWAIEASKLEIQYKFEVSKRGMYIKQLRLFEEDPYTTIGRDPGCHIQLLHESLSRSHA